MNRKHTFVVLFAITWIAATFPAQAFEEQKLAIVEPLGACCLDQGDCVEVTLDECAADDGEYHGDFTSCDAVECPQAGICLVIIDEDTIEFDFALFTSESGIYDDCITVGCDFSVGVGTDTLASFPFALVPLE